MDNILPIVSAICVVLLIIAVVVIIQQLRISRYRQRQIDRRDTELSEKDALVEEFRKRAVKLSVENAKLTTQLETYEELADQLRAENEENQQKILELSQELSRAQGYAEWAGNLGMETNKAHSRLRHKYIQLRARLSKYETVEEDEEDA